MVSDGWEIILEQQYQNIIIFTILLVAKNICVMKAYLTAVKYDFYLLVTSGI